MSIRSPGIVAVCLVLFLTTTGACGRKTMPLVPDSPRPETVKDIKAENRDTITVLTWAIPTRNVEGRAMGAADIQSFRIYRSEAGRDRTMGRYKQYAEIALANPSPATVRDGKVIWTDSHLKYGLVYGYKIRAVSVRGGVSPWSDEVRVAPLMSLGVPSGLAAQAGDSSILLSWDPVTTRMDGSHYEGFVGYNVYRGTEQGRYGEAALNTEPLRTNSYKDTTVVNDRTYYYMVRSVDSPALPWKESIDSTAASATPRDQTPPNRPMGITVVPGVNRVFLTWNENKERDLAGYRVYRSTRTAKDSYELLTAALLNRTTFSDTSVAGGVTYYYVVTAVDKAGNESAWPERKKAYIEKLR
jgi:fibronectin type 3 domain-containing protein